MKTAAIYTVPFLFMLLSACTTDKIPGVYRIDIQQGNDTTQSMINQLKPGMTKDQVAFLLGTPLIMDTFQPDRWDYLYSFQPGNGQRQQRRVTIYFNRDQLTHLEGDTRIVARDDLPSSERIDSDVLVPLSDKKEGLIQEIKDSMGFETRAEVPEEPNADDKPPVNPVPQQSEGIFDGITDIIIPD